MTFAVQNISEARMLETVSGRGCGCANQDTSEGLTGG